MTKTWVFLTYVRFLVLSAQFYRIYLSICVVICIYKTLLNTCSLVWFNSVVPVLENMKQMINVTTNNVTTNLAVTL